MTTPEKPPSIVDREADWRALGRIMSRPTPELVFVLGRRRVGKSYLLSRFARAVDGIYFQATRRTKVEQLTQLGHVLGEHFDDPALRHGVSFPSWERLLDYLVARAAHTPLLFVIDEFPYLTAAAPALPSILQRFWDHDCVNSRLKLILSGSFVTAMKALEAGDAPLHGRRTAKILLRPFRLPESSAFMRGWTARDQMLGRGIFGHLPGQLARIDSTVTLAENVAAAMLDATGPLTDEAQHVLDAFLGDTHVHGSILEAIATGDHAWSGILRRTGLTSGAVTRPLRWLLDMGLIARVVPITEKSPDRSKRAVYRITDPYLLFWHRTVAPLLRTGSIGLVEPRHLWDNMIEPHLDAHMGAVFEEDCRDHVRQGLGVPFTPLRVGEWWSTRGREGDAQIDVVALGADGHMLVGECKWGRIGRSDLSRLTTRGHLLAAQLGDVDHIHPVLYSGCGEADDTVRAEVKAGHVGWVTGEALVHGSS